MKYIASLLLLPSIIFASSIGTNSIGFKIGQANFGTEEPGIKTEFDGFGFELSGNLNTYSKDNYGLDLTLDAIFGNGLEGPLGIESDISKVDGALRPYMELSGIILFANVGFSHAEYDIPGILNSSESSFSPGVGLEFRLDKLTIRPSVDWVDYGTYADGTLFNLPISYSISEKYDITAQYDVASFDNDTFGGVTGKYIYDSLLIGVDYKF